MRCPNRGQLQGLLDDAVSEKKRNAIESHLKHCQRCKSEVEKMRASLAFVKERLGDLEPRTVPSDLFNPMIINKPPQVANPHRILWTSVQVPAISLVFVALAGIGLALSLFFTHRQLVNLRNDTESQNLKPVGETIIVSSPTRFQAYKLDINLEGYRPIRDSQVILFKEEAK